MAASTAAIFFVGVLQASAAAGKRGCERAKGGKPNFEVPIAATLA